MSGDDYFGSPVSPQEDLDRNHSSGTPIRTRSDTDRENMLEKVNEWLTNRPQDHFDIDLDARTVTCPAGVTTTIRALNHQRHAGIAEFGAACGTCPLIAQCTTAAAGRTVTIGHYEAQLTAGRARQTDPAWKADYRATRPKVERKIGHLMRRQGWPRGGTGAERPSRP